MEEPAAVVDHLPELAGLDQPPGEGGGGPLAVDEPDLVTRPLATAPSYRPRRPRACRRAASRRARVAVAEGVEADRRGCRSGPGLAPGRRRGRGYLASAPGHPRPAPGAAVRSPCPGEMRRGGLSRPRDVGPGQAVHGVEREGVGAGHEAAADHADPYRGISVPSSLARQQRRRGRRRCAASSGGLVHRQRPVRKPRPSSDLAIGLVHGISTPACTHGSSTPRQPEAPTPPSPRPPTLTGSPPGIAITPSSVTCRRTTGLPSAKRLAYSVVETRKLRAMRPCARVLHRVPRRVVAAVATTVSPSRSTTTADTAYPRAAALDRLPRYGQGDRVRQVVVHRQLRLRGPREEAPSAIRTIPPPAGVRRAPKRMHA